MSTAPTTSFDADALPTHDIRVADLIGEHGGYGKVDFRLVLTDGTTRPAHARWVKGEGLVRVTFYTYTGSLRPDVSSFDVDPSRVITCREYVGGSLGTLPAPTGGRRPRRGH